MSDFLAYTVLGVCLGAVYAIAATGLVVTYSTTGVFNVAQGAVATTCALVYWQLHIGWHLHALIALAITVFVAAPLIGIALEVVVMRGLRDTSEVTRLVIPIAVLLALTGACTWVWFRNGSRAIVPLKFFGEKNVKILGQAVYYHQIIGVVIAMAVVALLYVVLYRSRLGVTMRATVDDRRLLMLNGGRPDRAAMASWAIGSMLAALTGVLIAPQQGALQVFALTLLVFDAYPAAVGGRLKSVPHTLLWALVLGLAREYFDWISDAGQRWPLVHNLRNAVPAILLFAALLFLPQSRLRGAVVTRTRERFHVPTSRQAFAWAGVLVAVVAMLQALMKGAAIISLANGMALSLMALSLVLLTGYAGEINLAVYTFAGVALIVAWQFDVGPDGLATKESLSLKAVVLAMAVCAVVGGVIALPALRLSGLYLGLATFAFGIIVYQLVISQTQPVDISLFGNEYTVNLFNTGSLTVPRPNWLGIDFRDQRSFLMLMTVMFAVIGIGLVHLRRSPYGRMVVAMKDSPAACATLGMNIVRVKLAVFMLSSAIAGLGGLMWAAQMRTVPNNSNFDGFSSLLLFMIAVVGGIGYVSGALLAGLFLSVISVAMPDIFAMLGHDYPSLKWLFVGLIGNFTKFVGPAMVGIQLGKNPSGIAQQVMDGFRPLTRAPRALAAWAIGAVVLWFVTWRGVMSNWTFAILLMVSALFVPRLIMRARPDRLAHLRVPEVEHPDLIGVARPFTRTDREHFDRMLALPRVEGGA